MPAVEHPNIREPDNDGNPNQTVIGMQFCPTGGKLSFSNDLWGYESMEVATLEAILFGCFPRRVCTYCESM